MKLKVKKERFLKWYYSDISDYNLLGRLMVSQMRMNDTAEMSIQQVFNNAGYIPSFIVEGWNEKERKEYQPHECELIN